MGEHEYADVIDFGDRQTHRAEQIKTSYNKYEKMISKTNKESEKGYGEVLRESIFGPNQVSSTASKYGKGRLGVDSTLLVTNPLEGIYTA